MSESVKKSVLRFYRWWDYLIVAVNIVGVVSLSASGEFGQACTSAVMTVLYVCSIGFMNAYYELRRELERERGENQRLRMEARASARKEADRR